MKTLSIDVNIAKWVVEILLQGGKKQSNDCVLSTFFENWLAIIALVKPLQNKKGQKHFPGAQFSVSFSQLPAVKKDTKNCAHGKFFGSSYFVTTLACIYIYLA